MKTINVGVIGAGGIATGQHLPALVKQPDVKIVAICDTNPEHLVRAKEKFGIPHAFDDYKRMLEMDEIDAVHVCTPNIMHMPQTVDALNAGKHVLVEKPLARNAEEGAKMVEVARANKKKLMVAHNMRFNSESQMVKRFIDAGELGEIYFGRVLALRRRGIPSWGVFTNKELQGGGPLIDIGVHVLDLAMYLMGHPKPVAVSGSVYTKIGNTPGHTGVWGSWDHTAYTVEDYAAALIRYENGCSLVIESSFAANLGDEKMQVSLMGTKAGADVFPPKIYSEAHDTILDITPIHLAGCQPYEAEVRGFLDSIINDTEPPVTGEQSLNVMKILDAIYKSGEEKREIVID